MATSKKPQRAPLRIALSSRSRRLWILLVLSLASLSYLVFKAARLGAEGEEGNAGGAGHGVKYDREREEEGNGFPPLPELMNRDRLWPPDLDTPLCTPKIYVYTLPPHLTLPASTISQCRWSAYSSELLLHSLLTTPSSSSLQSTYVTSDPSEADLFFIPLFPSCYLFNCWVKAGWNKTERCGVDENYIQPIMACVREQGFWDANGGADHIIAHPMDFADGYYTESSRAAMNSSIYLVTVGDLRPPPFSQHYRRHRDIVIPSATHLLNSYFLNPMDYLDALGHPLATPASRTDQPTRVEIFRPSPTSPTGLWGKRPSFGIGRAQEKLKSGRGTTAIFRGGIGQPHEGEGYALGIRSLFFPSPPSHSGFSSLPLFDIAESSSNEDYALALSLAKYGLVPPGYTLDTTRIWEYLAFGVVPVFLGAGPTAGQVMPFADDFDYASFSISIPRERAHELPRILSEVEEEEYERLRRGVWETGRLLVLEDGRGNVWRWIVRDLCRMRGIGMGARSDVRACLCEDSLSQSCTPLAR